MSNRLIPLKVVYYLRFRRKFRKSTTCSKQLILDKTYIFINNPFNPELKTHKLTGKLSDYWSFSLNYSLRILFKFIDDNTVGFVDMGGHEIYR